MKILSFNLGGRTIVVSPVPFSRLAVLQILIQELTDTWERLGGDVQLLLAECLFMVQQIANLFPRLDVPPHPATYGWDVSIQSVEEVQELFLCQIDGDIILPGKLVALHQIDASESPQKPPEAGEDIDNWNPPVKSCGNPEIDSLGQLMAALSAIDVLTLYDRFDLGTINLLIQAYNAAQESPEDRRKQYLAQSYQKYKEENPDVINNALGLNRINDDFDPAKKFAEMILNAGGGEDERQRFE